jgi:hypothetical protein
MVDAAREARLKTAVVSFLGHLSRGEAMDGSLIAVGYVPHCAPLAGMPVLAPGADALRVRLRQRGAIPHRLYRMIADGDHVWTHSRFDGAVPVAGIDIFRFDTEDRIAEHWNVRQVIPHDDPNGVDRFAGEADTETVLDEPRRAEVRELIRVSQNQVWGYARDDLVFRYIPRITCSITQTCRADHSISIISSRPR